MCKWGFDNKVKSNFFLLSFIVKESELLFNPHLTHTQGTLAVIVSATHQLRRERIKSKQERLIFTIISFRNFDA